MWLPVLTGALLVPQSLDRLVSGLLKTAQGVPPGADTTLNPAQDAQLRLAAIRCLVGVLRSMSHWTNRQLRIGEGLAAGTSRAASDLIDLSGDGVPEEGKEEEAGAGGSGGGAAGGTGAGAGAGAGSSGGAAVEQSEAAMLEQRRAYKMELQVSWAGRPGALFSVHFVEGAM